MSDNNNFFETLYIRNPHLFRKLYRGKFNEIKKEIEEKEKKEIEHIEDIEKTAEILRDIKTTTSSGKGKTKKKKKRKNKKVDLILQKIFLILMEIL